MWGKAFCVCTAAAPPTWPPAEKARPAKKRPAATAAPAAGPATATSNRSARLGTMLRNGMTEPKVPTAPLGIRNDGPTLICAVRSWAPIRL